MDRELFLFDGELCLEYLWSRNDKIVAEPVFDIAQRIAKLKWNRRHILSSWDGRWGPIKFLLCKGGNAVLANLRLD